MQDNMIFFKKNLRHLINSITDVGVFWWFVFPFNILQKLSWKKKHNERQKGRLGKSSFISKLKTKKTIPILFIHKVCHNRHRWFRLEQFLFFLLTTRLIKIATLGLFLSLERHSRCGWSPTTRQYAASKVQANLIVYQILLTHMFMLQAYDNRNIQKLCKYYHDKDMMKKMLINSWRSQ